MMHCPEEIWEGLSLAPDFAMSLSKPDLSISHLTLEEKNNLHAVLKLSPLSRSAPRECIT
ncbi:hypothetical protein EK904_005584 [Melospiza melodia maxima]|nr:hypothetical protein EK904_005584 [Melospiza melodia maxima]